MAGGELLLAAGEAVLFEIALFAGVGFLLLGLGDLAVDLIWAWRRLFRRRIGSACAASLAPAVRPGRIAVLVPAWDEGQVIGAMLRHALAACT